MNSKRKKKPVMFTDGIFLFKRVGHWHFFVLNPSLSGRQREAVGQHSSSTAAFDGGCSQLLVAVLAKRK